MAITEWSLHISSTVWENRESSWKENQHPSASWWWQKKAASTAGNMLKWARVGSAQHGEGWVLPHSQDFESKTAAPVLKLLIDLKKSGKFKEKKPLNRSFYCSTWHQNRNYAFIGLCVSVYVSVCAWMHVVRTAGIEKCVYVCAQKCMCLFLYVSEWCMLACAVNTFKQFITQAVGKPFAKQCKGLLIRLKSLSNPPWRQNPSVTHNDTQRRKCIFSFLQDEAS